MSRPAVTVCVRAAAAAVSGESTRRAWADTAAELDDDGWREVLTTAQIHGLAYAAGSGLQQAPSEVPEETAYALRHAMRAASARALAASEDLDAIVTSFNQAGIVPLILKGGLLAFTRYPDPAQRPFDDLDICVSIQEREAAALVLEDLGYRLSVEDRGKEWYTAHHHHWAYSRPASSTVELHWNLLPPSRRWSGTLEQLLRRVRERSWPQGGRIRELDDVDQIVYAAMHAAEHQFELPLRHYLDLVVLLPRADWPDLRERARAAGAEMELGVFLGIADRLGFLTLAAREREEIAALLDGCLDLNAVAEYAVSWPFREDPLGLVKILSARGSRARLRALRESLCGSPGPSSIHPSVEQPAHGLPSRGAGRRLGYLLHADEGFRTKVALYRQFPRAGEQ